MPRVEAVWARVVTDLGLSAMAGKRYLIVNADDFGQSEGFNQGVIEAHERGLVTSASLMVRWPSAAGAAELARAHPSLSLGLHFDLGEWTYRGGEWLPVYQVAAPDDAEAVDAEAERQLARFRELVGRDPTHLDAHQHVHRDEPVRSILLRRAGELGIPLRSHDARIAYRGDFYGQTAKGDPLPEAIRVEALLAVLASLPMGTTELGCHPGESEPEGRDCMYVAERPIELATLCDPRVRAMVHRRGITLMSFAELARAPTA